MKQKRNPLTAIDLFCGAGGLTLGLKRAGFKVTAGVELYPEIAKTYKANHPTTKLLIKDIREVTGKELFELTGLKEIDLLVGCPPCQGFSKLTDKYHRKDPRNDLVLQIARVIQEMMPKMVMMENVSGLATRGKPILDEFVRRLESLGYLVNVETLQLAGYGVPQSRRRVVLLAGKGFHIPMPKLTHCRSGDPKKNLKPWLRVADVIKDMEEPVTLSEAVEQGGPKKFNWHVVRDLTEMSIRRFQAIKPGTSRYKMPMELRPKCHQNNEKGFPNVYGRLSWEQVPPTITAGCTTPCKGRFGHPEELRTISVREAALIQTFPKSYKFDTQFMDTACDLVGNALPCAFARIVAAKCRSALMEQSLGGS
ncbi:MAG: DNA cytosine methyltransferase [candidate division Zixibacteria bacterium]|nr:DNA cytosine methyltransferase [candidate division Zixibacteria bacterium]